MFTYTLVSALVSATLALATPAPAPAITPAPIYNRQSGSALELKCQAQYESMAARAPDLPFDHPIIQWLNQPENINIFTDFTDIDKLCAAVWGKNSVEPPSSLSSQWSSYRSEVGMFGVSMKGPADELKSMGCPASIAAGAGLLAITEERSCSVAYKAYLDAFPYLTADEDDAATTSSTQTNTIAPSTTTGSSQETAASGNDSESEDGNGSSGSDSGSTEEGSTETTSTSTAGSPKETGHVAVAAAAAIAIAGAMAAL
ncbi:hypothetical protein QBC36DRAFT_70384 [Triangularia setosa]|uniref:Infection structure specific protein n=1 Tax=Triangularia setosa TaxID=2587417 RepID=A0AAN6WCN5_9PEZI|nr:hypothetical protein QBC36DRAFT_70384 [Podospora setosa]